MKKVLIGLTLALAATSANADFFGGNNGEWKMGPNGPYYDESDWPEWTPMYWMEELFDNFGDDDDNYGGMGGYQAPMMGYPQMQMPPANYGYGAPAMPYGNNYGYQQPQMPAYPAPSMPAAPAAPLAPTPVQ